MPVSNRFRFVFLALSLAGLAAGWIVLHISNAESTAEALDPSAELAAAPSIEEQTPRSGANAAAQTQLRSDFAPPRHPEFHLPMEARIFLENLEQSAHSKPADIAQWDKFGVAALRAAMFDPSYYHKAEEAYAQALALDPDDPTALRGIGDIDYDHAKYDQAVAAYQHYLKHQPDDPEVRTNLGTMYLYSGNADQAIREYRKAISSKPDLYRAHYHLAIALAQRRPRDSQHAADKRSYAANGDSPGQVKALIAQVNSEPIAAQSPSLEKGSRQKTASPPFWARAQRSLDQGAPGAAQVTLAAPGAQVVASVSKPSDVQSQAGTSHDGESSARGPALASPISGLRDSDLHDTFYEIRGGHRHAAIDINEPLGTPVHAVVSGTIRKRLFSRPGGNSIYEIDTADKYCYHYTHLDRYADLLHEGMRVSAGDIIGYVGATGTAKTPHLHFAIYLLGPDKRWYGGTAIDPYPALQVVSRLARRR